MPLRRFVLVVVGAELAIALVILFHIGENTFQGTSLYRFAPLLGALFGSGLTFFSALSPTPDEPSEPWLGHEQLGWVVIGCGQLLWGLGESFWRYYTAIGEPTFPSIADAGYACFPALCFIGLVLQPNSGGRLQRTLVVLDSLIAMGALLAIGWYLLLGALAQSPSDNGLAQFVGLYYPTADVSLLSCVIFLLMRGQSPLYQVTARKVSLWTVGLGLCLFATSDFLFNLQQNAGTYVDGTWVDLGWPLGMMTIGLAAYLRNFLPRTTQDIIKTRRQNNIQSIGLRPVQSLPYTLILILFTVLAFNIISPDKTQQNIRLVLFLATFAVICLVLLRQILTIRENERLSFLQARTLQKIEEQAHQIMERNKELEDGIAHLQAIQTSLANGNPRARAHLKPGGVLWNLGGSLNLLAERLTSLGETKRQSDRLRNALFDLARAIERQRAGQPFKLPFSCKNIPEITMIAHVLDTQKTPLPPSTLPEKSLSHIPQLNFPGESNF
jgi:hypothetical protein